MFPDSPIVRQGTFRYSGDTACDVCIQRTNCRYGSGDQDDEADIRDDVDGEFYYIWYSPAGTRGDFRNGGGVFPTLGEAVRAVEKSVVGIEWNS
jgi:hypothetical protein